MSAVPRPFHVVPGAAGARRLLLISWHFPPGQAVGALRWQKFAPLAAERGWALDVVTADPADLDGQDPARLGDLPPGTRLFGARAGRTFSGRIDAALTRWRSGASQAGARDREPRSAAPDLGRRSLLPEEIRWSISRQGLSRAYGAWIHHARDAAWARSASRIAIAVGRSSNPAAVISCGPPHAAHEVGRRTAEALARSLVLDLRDPWSARRRLPDAYASPLHFLLADRDEQRAVRAAALVVTNTAALGAAMQARYPGARFLTVMNGWDDAPPPVQRTRFLLAYAGSIYLDRDPRPLLKAFRRLVEARGITPADAGFELMGAVDPHGRQSLGNLAAAEGVAPFVRLHPRGPREAALRFLSEAAVLVSLQQDSPWAIPSKVFEYMPYHAWLLALADPGTPTAALLSGTGADVVAPQDTEALARVLIHRYDAFAGGERPGPIAGYEAFSRRAQAVVLLDALDSLTASR